MSNVKPCSLWMTHYSGNPLINYESLRGRLHLLYIFAVHILGFRKAGVTEKCAKDFLNIICNE